MKCVCRRARRPGSRQIEISKAGRPPVRPPIQISTKLSSAGCRARRPGRFEIIRILIFLGGGPFETQFKTNGCFMIRKTRWFSVRFRMGPGRIWNAIFSTRFGRFRGQSDAAIYIYIYIQFPFLFGGNLGPNRSVRSQCALLGIHLLASFTCLL